MQQHKLNDYFLSDEEKVISALEDCNGKIIIPFGPNNSMFLREAMEKAFGIPYDNCWDAIVSLRRKRVVWYVPNYKTKFTSFVLARRFTDWKKEHKMEVEIPV